jgi:hypothetical protein
MSRQEVGCHGHDDHYRSIAAYDSCDEYWSNTYQFEYAVHAFDDEKLGQAYDEVIEDKENRWHIHSYFGSSSVVPRSPIDPDLRDNYPAIPDSIECHVTQANSTDGSDRVQFNDPDPNGNDSNESISAGFTVGVAGSWGGVSAGAAVGISYTIDSTYYDGAYGEAHHSYWDVNYDGNWPTEPENEDNGGVGIDVEAYSIAPATEYVETASKFNFSYYQDVGDTCGQPVFNIIYDSSQKLNTTTAFDIVGSS